MSHARRSLVVLISLLCACEPTSQPPSIASAASTQRAAPTIVSAAPAASARATASQAPVDSTVRIDQKYPWIADPKCDAPAVVGTLEERFAAPPGSKRVAVAHNSFGAWLRTLPLAEAGTPVLTYQGKVLHPASHENIAAVVAIDIGKADLQQCADSVIRLHAEWRWSRGERSMAYRAAAGTQMTLESWLKGARPVADGPKLRWEETGRISEPTHSSFRRYLDDVFAWANTGSLAVQAKPIDVSDLQPGDFVIVAGSPGHAVLVLDLVTDDQGRRRALLGQGYMPAQSFQVLRPDPSTPWFTIDASSAGLTTPFWPTFPWSSLRRLSP